MLLICRIQKTNLEVTITESNRVNWRNLAGVTCQVCQDLASLFPAFLR